MEHGKENENIFLASKSIASALRLLTIPNSYLADYRKSMQQIGASFASITQSFNSALTLSMPKFDSIFKSLQPLFASMQALREIHQCDEFLQTHGWYLTSALTAEIKDEIYQRREELTTDEIDKIITDFFRSNNCEELREMILSWNEIPLFESRKEKFRQAVGSHWMTWYDASTALLIPQFDGIALDFMGGKKTGVSLLEKMEQEVIDELSLSELPYRYFIPVQYAHTALIKMNRKDTGFNRHGVLHGTDTVSKTEKESLLLFFFMNDWYNLFRAIQIATDDRSLICSSELCHQS